MKRSYSPAIRRRPADRPRVLWLLRHRYGIARMITVINRGSIGAEQVCQLLREIKRRSRKPVTLVLDNASYQRARVVRELAETLDFWPEAKNAS